MDNRIFICSNRRNKLVIIKKVPLKHPHLVITRHPYLVKLSLVQSIYKGIIYITG